MKAFGAMFWAGVTMLRRDRVLLITSLGLALISILVFGWLFTGNGASTLNLGVVDQDHTTITSQLIAGLKKNSALKVSEGTQSEETQALRDGNRGAVIIMAPGFGADFAQGHATLQVYYDQSSPVEEAIARAAVQSIVASLNQSTQSAQSEHAAQGAHATASVVTLHEDAVSVRNLRQIDWLTPGMVGMLLMWANLTVGVVLVGWREQGIMRRLAATPLRPGALVGAQILARLTLSLAQAVVLLGAAMLIFKVQIVGSWLALLATMTLGSLTLLSLGFVIGAFARTATIAQAISTLISFPMMFLSGSYFPTNNAPAFLAPVIKALPLSYLNDALRQIINNGAGLTASAVQGDLLVLAAWMLAALLLSTRAFRWA